MKTGTLHTASPKADSERPRGQFTTFFIFLLFAAITWFFIKLSDEFSSLIIYKVEYENIPTGQILVKASDSTITLGFDATGFELIGFNLLRRKQVVGIDVSGVRMKPGNDGFNAALLTNGLKRQLAAQLGSNKELLFISPDTLKFEFLPEYRKFIPVEPMVQIQLRPQYMLYDSTVIKPDSIWIYGPRDIVDTITSIRTVPVSFNDLHRDVNTKLSIQALHNLPVSFSETEVELSIRVEMFTEKAFELSIQIDCAGNDFSLRIFPENVVVHSLVALRDYKRVEAGMFNAVVRCANLDQQSSTKLKVEIRDFPSYVRITRLEPERVEYIMVKTQQ